ncbi:hypothetical protein [Lysobacter brunescens]|uniref:hypothetical protein n=1 Tax=Lysobacter brunescens TaxID=262323 RepID=UPI0036D92CD7
MLGSNPSFGIDFQNEIVCIADAIPEQSKQDGLSQDIKPAAARTGFPSSSITY